MLTISVFSRAFAILLALKAKQVDGQPYPEFANKISPALLSALENGDTPDALVMFSGGNAEPLQRSSLLDIDDRGERNAAIRDQLIEHSDQSQDGVLNLLSTLRSTDDQVEFRKFWISNQMWVKGGDMKTIRAITEDPQVTYVDIEPVRALFDGEEKTGSNPGDNDRPEDGTIQWNIQRIRVPEARQELGGTQGEGVHVGVRDTGVLHTHETLRDNFLGNYGWLDGTFRGKLEPYDDTWHGTHVTIKPDITAYGEDVLSATPHTEDHYRVESGTSFSCPQVARVVALLLSRDLTLTFSQVTQLLYNNTDHESLQVPGKNYPPFVWLCDSVINGTLVHPNNHYGYGLIDALQAVKAQANEMS